MHKKTVLSEPGTPNSADIGFILEEISHEAKTKLQKKAIDEADIIHHCEAMQLIDRIYRRATSLRDVVAALRYLLESYPVSTYALHMLFGLALRQQLSQTKYHEREWYAREEVILECLQHLLLAEHKALLGDDISRSSDEVLRLYEAILSMAVALKGCMASVQHMYHIKIERLRHQWLLDKIRQMSSFERSIQTMIAHVSNHGITAQYDFYKRYYNDLPAMGFNDWSERKQQRFFKHWYSLREKYHPVQHVPRIVTLLGHKRQTKLLKRLLPGPKRFRQLPSYSQACRCLLANAKLHDHCFNVYNHDRGPCEIWTQEFVYELAELIIVCCDRVYELHPALTYINICEVGAGDGSLMYALIDYLKHTRSIKRPYTLNMDASDLHPVTSIDAAKPHTIAYIAPRQSSVRQAIKRFANQHTLFICSWIPWGAVWPKYFQASADVFNYILIGSPSKCGRRRVWQCKKKRKIIDTLHTLSQYQISMHDDSTTLLC